MSPRNLLLRSQKFNASVLLEMGSQLSPVFMLLHDLDMPYFLDTVENFPLNHTPMRSLKLCRVEESNIAAIQGKL